MAHIDHEVNNEKTTNGTEGLFSVDYPVMEKAMKTTIKVLRVEPLSEVDKVEKVEREVTYSPDEVTVVESTDKLLYTKKLVYEGGKLVNKVSAPRAVWHKATNRTVSNYDELNALLLELSGNKTACVIRGQVFDCHQGEKVQRTNQGGWKKPEHSNVKKAQTAFFMGVPRRWLCVDIDGDDSKGLDCFVYAPVPSGTPSEVAHFMAHWLVNTWLPEPFRGCRAVVQFSSSFWASGVSSKVKAHIWFLLDEPIGAKEVMSVMWQAYSNEIAGDGKPYVMGAEEGQRRLDGSTARIAHPNFTASPLVIEDGVVVPDKHIDYRVIEVNKDGGRVSTATLLSDLEAANESKATKQKSTAGGIVEPKAKTVHKSDPTAKGDILTWDAKTHADYKLAQEALTFLGASYYDFYKPWLEVGMCIHYRFAGQEGLDLWTQWSKQSAHYTESEVEYECESKWGTFTTDVENPRTLGKLFGMASDNGWSGLKKGASEDHSQVDGAVETEQSFFESDVVEITGVGVASDATSYALDLERNDNANAKRLFNAFGDRLRCIADTDRWAVFQDGRWVRLEQSSRKTPCGILTEMISYVVDRIGNEGLLRARRVERAVEAAALRDGLDTSKAKEKAKKAAASELTKYTQWRDTSHQPTPRRAAMLSILADAPGITTQSSDWDDDAMSICAPNGIIDLRTATIRPYDHQTLVLRQCGASFTPENGHDLPPFAWDAVAAMMGRPGDEGVTEEAAALTEYVWDFLAYCLTGDTSRQKFVVWYGALGGNGKSTLQSMMEAILGKATKGGYYTTVNESSIIQSKSTGGSARSDMMGLIGARMAVVTDMTDDNSIKLDVGVIKAITGQDTLSYREIYRTQTEFTPTCKLMMSCNAIPRFAADGGMSRRFEALPFERAFREVPLADDPADPHRPAFDPALKAKLIAAKDAIFTHLVFRAKALYERGFKIAAPARVTDFSSATLEAMSPLRNFVDECCVRCDEYVTNAELRDGFSLWATRNRVQGATWSQHKLTTEMKRLGFQEARKNSSRGFTGLRIQKHLLPSSPF